MGPHQDPDMAWKIGALAMQQKLAPPGLPMPSCVGRHTLPKRIVWQACASTDGKVIKGQRGFTADDIYDI